MCVEHHLPDANGEEIILKLKATCPIATITIINNQQNPDTTLQLQKLVVNNFS
jgi:hypothetical protein